MIVEQKFRETFEGKIGQVFLYLTDTCNLSCIQCLYKTELTFQLKQREIPFAEALGLMQNMYALGARKITFMGGEPTLYRELPQLIVEAKAIGYTYVRMDTNGMFAESLLDDPRLMQIDEITFSLDGHTPDINDALRGKGVFVKCISNIKSAIARGYNVHTTTCVHAGLLTPTKESEEVGLISLIKMLKNLGVESVNMHDLFKSGIPRDVWSGDVALNIEDYIEVFDLVQSFASQCKDNSIRMPQCVVRTEEFHRNPEYYGYCSVKQFDRILAFPNGMIRVCSLMIGSPYCVGYYDKDSIYWNTTPTNEVLGHEMDKDTKCTNQGKGRHFSQSYVPLCVSFKPKQHEPVWEEHLHWELRRKDYQ